MNPFKTLGVSVKSTADEIKQTYHAKAKQYHPDITGETEQFTAITAAFNALKADLGRKREAEKLALSHKQCLSCRGSGKRWKQQGFNSRVAYTCIACAGLGMVVK